MDYFDAKCDVMIPENIRSDTLSVHVMRCQVGYKYEYGEQRSCWRVQTQKRAVLGQDNMVRVCCVHNPRRGGSGRAAPTPTAEPWPLRWEWTLLTLAILS